MDCMCICVHIHAYTCVSRHACGQATLTHNVIPFDIPNQCACFGLYTNRDGHVLPEFWLSLPFTLPEGGEWKFLTEKLLWSR